MTELDADAFDFAAELLFSLLSDFFSNAAAGAGANHKDKLKASGVRPITNVGNNAVAEWVLDMKAPNTELRGKTAL